MPKMGQELQDRFVEPFKKFEVFTEEVDVLCLFVATTSMNPCFSLVRNVKNMKGWFSQKMLAQGLRKYAAGLIHILKRLC